MRRMLREREELNTLPNWSFAMPMAMANAVGKAPDGAPETGAPPLPPLPTFSVPTRWRTVS